MGRSEPALEPVDMLADFHISIVLVVVPRYSIVVEEESGGTARQEEEVDNLWPVAVAFEAVVGILEVVVVRIAVRRARLQLEQGHNILVDIVLKAEHNYTLLLLVEVDLEGLGMRKESQAFGFAARYKEPLLEKSCSGKSDSMISKARIPSSKLFPSCWICPQPCWRTHY